MAARKREGQVSVSRDFVRCSRAIRTSVTCSAVDFHVGVQRAEAFVLVAWLDNAQMRAVRRRAGIGHCNGDRVLSERFCGMAIVPD